MNEYHWLPSQWLALSVKEKAMVVAGIDIRQEQEKKEQKKAEAKARSHRR
ncbi:hypothetical protein [Lacticaseibacillus saniviri]|nr:hypothetical protein [Lacticaseibacillus saniviri]